MSRTICPAILAFLAAAAFPTVVLCASVPFVGYGYDLETALMMSVVFFPIALVAVILLGVPAFVLLYRFRPGQWWMPVVAGLILGIPLLHALPGRPSTSQALIFVPLTACPRWPSGWSGDGRANEKAPAARAEY